MVGPPKGQAWRAIKWAWREYKVARLFGDGARMMEAATRIRLLQASIGVRRSNFRELGLAWPDSVEDEGPTS